MDFSPAFEGANEAVLLFQAALKWSPRRVPLAEEAQQIHCQRTAGVTQRASEDMREDGAGCELLSTTTSSVCNAAGLVASR